ESNEEITVNDLLLDALLLQWVPSNYVPSAQLLNTQDEGKQEMLIALEERQMALQNYLRHIVRSIEEYREDPDDQTTKNPSIFISGFDSLDKSNDAFANCIPIAYNCEYPVSNQKEPAEFVSFYPGFYQPESNPTDTGNDKDEITDDIMKSVLDLLTSTNQSDDDYPDTSSCVMDCEALNPERSSNFLQVLTGQKKSLNSEQLNKDSLNENYGTYFNCLAEKVSCLYKEMNGKVATKTCSDSRGVKEAADESDDQGNETSNADSIKSRIFEKWYFPSIAQDLLRSMYSNSKTRYNDNKYTGYRKSLSSTRKPKVNGNHRSTAQNLKSRSKYLSNRSLYTPIRGGKDRVANRMVMTKQGIVQKNVPKPKQ
ncbi:hypothetical protein ILUMI_04028, partial [Ignelater luminosus]